MVNKKLIIPYVKSKDQVRDTFTCTKALGKRSFTLVFPARSNIYMCLNLRESIISVLFIMHLSILMKDTIVILH